MTQVSQKDLSPKVTKRKGEEMDGKYTFNEFKQNLDDGYQI